MRSFAQTYSPYDLSSAKCHVVEILISETGATRIEVKLPPYIKIIKGVYVTSKTTSTKKATGYINLFFNEGVTKSISLPIYNSRFLKSNSHPLKLNEEIKPNSSMQGFYLDILASGPYSIKIYLHYK